MSKWFSAIPLTVVVALSSACASKGFVNTRVKNLNDKVEALSHSVEETQERTRKIRKRRRRRAVPIRQETPRAPLMPRPGRRGSGRRWQTPRLLPPTRRPS
jgi:hypothetical protein